MITKIDARKLDEIHKMIIKDVRKMQKFVEQFAIRDAGIQPNGYIDKIQLYIEDTILIPAEIKKV